MIMGITDFELFVLDNKNLVGISMGQMISLDNKFHFCKAKDKLKLLDRNDPQDN
jgi:hypothetical protein